MKFIFKKYLLTSLALFITTQLLPALSIKSQWQGFLYASLLLGILFYIVRPILTLIMFPINLLTLNLSSWLIQIGIFYIWTILGGGLLTVTSWQFPGIHTGLITLSPFDLLKWQVIIVASIIYILFNKLLDWICK